MIATLGFIATGLITTIASAALTLRWMQKFAMPGTAATLFSGLLFPLLLVSFGVAGSLMAGSGVDDPPPGAILGGLVVIAIAALPISLGLAAVTVALLQRRAVRRERRAIERFGDWLSD
jgi:hypothetical protein